MKLRMISFLKTFKITLQSKTRKFFLKVKSKKKFICLQYLVLLLLHKHLLLLLVRHPHDATAIVVPHPLPVLRRRVQEAEALSAAPEADQAAVLPGEKVPGKMNE